VTGGSLPAGLTLNASTGAITGTPTATASGGVTFTVTDSSGPVQTKSVALTLTIAATTLTITTVSLPGGQVGIAYSATLAATGGTTPYTWTVTGGSLPAGLTLNASTGAITGTPTSTASAGVTFTVTDSSAPVQTKSATLTLTITASGITVSVSPKRAGLVTGQMLPVTPTTNDASGVNWTATGGNFSATKSLTGIAVTYTAPGTPGTYTITATSVGDPSKTATVSVAVTDLAGVATYHNNNARNGANTQEYALTTSSVNTSTFGKLFSCTVDGAIYAQPLWVPNVMIGGVTHNVVFVATMGDSVYAFDADSPGSGTCAPLWRASMLSSSHGANSGEVTVESCSNQYVGVGNQDICPEVGILGTPVIDLTTNTLYVVSKSMVTSGPTFYQRLHALDITTGDEKLSGPVPINYNTLTYPGTAEGGSTTHFDPRVENQRPGLALVNGVVYVAWASHEDGGSYYGWVAGYNASNLFQISTFNDEPNTFDGGIWMSGGAPAADAGGSLYLITGNGTFDAANASPPKNDYGDTFLKLSSGLSVQNYFTPTDQLTDQTQDKDFGAGGATVLIDLPSNGTNPTHLVMGGGKDHVLYVLDRDKAAWGYGDGNAWQQLTLNGGLFATGAYWNSTFYIATLSQALQAFNMSASTAKFTQAPQQSPNAYGFPGATPSVTSAPDNSNGIVWALDTSAYCVRARSGCSSAVLHAYDANNLSSELWNSSQNGSDAAGIAVKFTVPTVANGKVYVGTRGNNQGGADSGSTIPGELDVYGLKPN
jgi:hypothetical protein